MVDGCKLVVGVMRTLNTPDRVRPLGLMSGAGKPFFHRASKVGCCEKGLPHSTKAFSVVGF